MSEALSFCFKMEQKHLIELDVLCVELKGRTTIKTPI